MVSQYTLAGIRSGVAVACPPLGSCLPVWVRVHVAGVNVQQLPSSIHAIPVNTGVESVYSVSDLALAATIPSCY